MSDVDLPLHGGCGCGAVRFEIDRPLVAAAYCHCTRCRHRTGTGAQASAVVEPGSVRVTAGEDRVRGWHPGGLEKAFCGDCGAAVFAWTPDEHEIRVVRLGAIEGDPGVRPFAHQFVDDAPVWEPVADDGLPRFAGRAGDGDPR